MCTIARSRLKASFPVGPIRRSIMCLALRYTRVAAVMALLGTSGSQAGAADNAPLLLRNPALSRTHIAFSFGGRIWVANRDGSNPHRLTAVTRAQ